MLIRNKADRYLHLRQPALPGVVWLAVLVPAVMLTVVPALLEFVAAWMVARRARA